MDFEADAALGVQAHDGVGGAEAARARRRAGPPAAIRPPSGRRRPSQEAAFGGDPTNGVAPR
ncbi:hypothetical protein ACFXHD_13710, partial [Streptomyces hydrogenans]